jgi:transcription initiation factor IIE alpha subunit
MNDVTKTNGEEKRERFLRLAPKRTNKVLKDIATLSHCASAGYELTEAEAREIIAALRGAVDELEQEFNRRLAPKRERTFNFTQPSA